MAGKSRPSILKREREFKKRERQLKKAAKAAQKRETRAEGPVSGMPGSADEPMPTDDRNRSSGAPEQL